MRRAARTDANQPLIVRALRDAGATVQILAGIGQGCPDLLVGLAGVNLLMEIKDPMRKPSEQALTDDEVEFHAAWKGQVAVVKTVREALTLLERYA